MPSAERIYSALLFLFPAAAWVNVAPTLLGDGNWVGVGIASLMFVFLPVEFFSSHLWTVSERFALKSALDNVLRRVLVDMIDVLRILSLSIAYAMAPMLVASGEPHEHAVRLGLFWWGVGWFLLLNRAWNWALSPLHKEIISRFQKSVIERENRLGEPLQNKIVDVVYGLTVGALTVTAPLFSLVFPLFGFVALSAALAMWLPGSSRWGFDAPLQILAGNSAWIFLVLLTLQVALKTGQVSALSILNSSFSRAPEPFPMSNSPPKQPSEDIAPAQDLSPPSGRTNVGAEEGLWRARAFELAPRMRSVVVEQTIDLRELMTFRTLAYSKDTHRKYPGATNLVLDDWDRLATHFIVKQDDEIIGAARLCSARNGRLPVSDEVSALQIQSDDLELGRMLVREDKRNGLAAAVMLAMTAVELEKVPRGRLYVDTVEGDRHTFGEERLLRMGFSSIGRTYQDLRYGLESNVYLLNNKKVFFNWCRRISLKTAAS